MNREERATPLMIFLIFLRLGLTSFGGPIAHLGYFRQEFVIRRRWLDERAYADLIALCQFLPGPASSQLGLALGYQKTGYSGALAAWAGFTLPSALFLIVFALGLIEFGARIEASTFDGLMIAAVAVVAQTVCGMASSLCTELRSRLMMLAAACSVLLGSQYLSMIWLQLAIMILAAGAGYVMFSEGGTQSPNRPTPGTSQYFSRSRRSLRWLFIFLLLLFGLPLLTPIWSSGLLDLFDRFYRAGALVFGGGHVVLPLLEAEVVATGLVNADSFIAGYGVTQAVPGPLFTFSAFLGATAEPGQLLATSAATDPLTIMDRIGHALICLLAIFLPSFMLVFAALPWWAELRKKAGIRACLQGVNAAVVGLLLAALYDPLWTSAIGDSTDMALLLIAAAGLMWLKLPPWLVVITTGIVGWLI